MSIIDITSVDNTYVLIIGRLRCLLVTVSDHALVCHQIVDKKLLKLYMVTLVKANIPVSNI